MRKIIHIDMDAFFASIEQRDNPELRGKAIAVGGRPESRGVVATASYEARKFGIKSAMPMATALRQCPQLLVVPSRMTVYRQTAEQIRQIFFRFTDKIEPLSIDEAYLDVTESSDFQGSATLLAHHIIGTIYLETGLTASAGVSYCKFLAKYASDVNKPNGVYTIAPDQALGIISQLPIEKFHGIGPATQKKLNTLNIYTGLDLREANVNLLRQHIGKKADFFYQLANGKDERPIRVHRERKSLGNEQTFVSDVEELAVINEHMNALLSQLWCTLLNKQILPLSLTVKVKYTDFTLQTKSYTQSSPIYSANSAKTIAEALLLQLQLERPIRLIGVAFSRFVPVTNYPVQQRLFD